MKRPHWTDAETEIAYGLVDRRATDEECWATVGRGRMACVARVERMRSAANRLTAGPVSEGPRRIPDGVAREALARAYAGPRDLTGALMGDPPKGYSALERRT